MKLFHFLLRFTIVILLVLGCLAETRQDRSVSPRLVLIISVDQFRADYLFRFEEGFNGGLRRFLRDGVVYLDAHQDHAVTSTGPGHASISTGAYPSHSGIVGNQWYENDGKDAVYCVEDNTAPLVRRTDVPGRYSSSSGRSSRNLLVTGLPDWMKAADSKSKAYSASRKDRASILMGGKNPDGAFWYDPDTGQMVTSTFYADEQPEWLKEFNRVSYPDKFFGRQWTRLEGVSASGQTEIQETDYGWFKKDFPYAIGSAHLEPDRSFYSSFGGTPYMDDYLALFAKTLIESQELGVDDHVDYLGLSFSVLDSVGHSFGPHSQEVFDTVVRLDRTLGDLFSFIDGKIGLDRTLIVLTADHGSMDLPELRLASGGQARRFKAEDIQCLQTRGRDFMIRYGAEEDWFVNGFYLNYAAIGRKNLRRQDLEQAGAALIEQCDSVQKVWTRTEVEKDGEDYFHRLFRNSFHPARSPDLLVQMKEFVLTSQGTGTSHGTPYRYDTHVPLVFLVPGAQPAHRSGRAATVDIAPTLASLLSIAVPDSVDGVDRSGELTRVMK